MHTHLLSYWAIRPLTCAPSHFKSYHAHTISCLKIKLTSKNRWCRMNLYFLCCRSWGHIYATSSQSSEKADL